MTTPPENNDQTERKSAENNRLAIWIPVIVAIISALFSLLNTIIANQAKSQANQSKQLAKVSADSTEIFYQKAKETIMEVPPGTILPFGGAVITSAVPEGYVICDGSSYPVDHKKFQLLFETIGCAWGCNNDRTRFNVPDLRGMFLRGVDNIGVDDVSGDERTARKTGGNEGRNVGSYQSYAFTDHEHHFNMIHVNGPPPGARGANAVIGLNYQFTDLNSSPDVNGKIKKLVIDGTTSQGQYKMIRHEDSRVGKPNASTVDNGPAVITGSEVRPKNVYVNYIIKL